jgi:hypothetical protein
VTFQLLTGLWKYSVVFKDYFSDTLVIDILNYNTTQRKLQYNSKVTTMLLTTTTNRLLSNYKCKVESGVTSFATDCGFGNVPDDLGRAYGSTSSSC